MLVPPQPPGTTWAAVAGASVRFGTAEWCHAGAVVQPAHTATTAAGAQIAKRAETTLKHRTS
jgi:hypothetical protein